ncbi:MAG: hypothetical protein RIS45_1766 [Planctomycetota bacterium]
MWDSQIVVIAFRLDADNLGPPQTALCFRSAMSAPATSPTPGRTLLAARMAERCDGCGAERPRGSDAFCRCTAPKWRPFCTRCARAFEGELCPNCLAVAEVNGRKLRTNLDEILARDGGLAGASAAFARVKARAESTLREFGIDAAVAPLPTWAARLVDKNLALPPGAQHSRPKMAAINELRLEEAAVRLALTNLGYTGKPTDDKLAKTVATAESALGELTSWDGLSAGGEHEQRLSSAASTLSASLSTASTLLETVRRRDLSALVEAAVRRSRALRNCQSALGVA